MLDISKTPRNPWALTTEALCTALETDARVGLTDTEVSVRLADFGKNDVAVEAPPSLFKIFFRQFANPLIAVLLVAVGLTLILGEWMDASIVAFAILVNVALGFIQEYKAERAIANLRSYVSDRARVIRNGHEIEIDAHRLVPGDILHVTHGVRVTADARLFQITNLLVDESILTGESLPVVKNTDLQHDATPLAERTNMLFAGTLAVGGSGYAVISQTGARTELGVIAELTKKTHSERTPLQHAVTKLTRVVVVVITVLVTGIFALGISQDHSVYDMLILSIAIIVGAVPEALPIGLTSVLAIGVERVAKRKGIIRSLVAAETLGSTTLIMTDKTGTLTQARLDLVNILLTEQMLNTTYDHTATRRRYSVEQKELLQLASTSADVLIEDETLHPNEWKMSGSPLETMIVRLSALFGKKISSTEKEHIHVRIPFASEHKFSVAHIPATLLPEAYDQYENPHVVVGAPEVLLARSSMDKESYLVLLKRIEDLSKNGFRVIGVGLVTPRLHTESLHVDAITDMTFLGILSFRDPIRPEVPDALARIYAHGVKVVMITGDLPGTARAVGNELGWDIKDNGIITGTELMQCSDEQLLERMPHIRIYARVTPTDKVRIVKLYQRLGEVVAMTGDGVNDGPALKAANIGVAVGSGSDVAKSIADLVLVDDNFETIVATIEEGKQMLTNIKKIFVYLMSNSLDEIVLIGGSILLGLAMPLSAVQIIWVNLFTGSIPAIAFAFDRQISVGADTGRGVFFDKVVLLLVGVIGVCSSVLLLALYAFLVYFEIPLAIAQSIVFACFGSYILVVAFSFRNLHAPLFTYPLFDNHALTFGVFLGLTLTFATIYTPFFQNIFNTVAVPPWWLLFIVGWLILNVLLVEGAKWVVNKK